MLPTAAPPPKQRARVDAAEQQPAAGVGMAATIDRSNLSISCVQRLYTRSREGLARRSSMCTQTNTVVCRTGCAQVVRQKIDIIRCRKS